MVTFDTSQIRARRVIDECNGGRFSYETGWGATVSLGREAVPILYMARERLPNPIELYSKMLELGNEYGIIKLVVRENNEEEKRRDANKFLSLHADAVWLRTRVQFFRSFRKQRRKILEFHRRLYSRHRELNRTFNKIPSIDKRTIDLYRLWSCVQLRGGYEKVCQRKLWAQIGREMGYSGKIVSSLSTSLRSAYAKVLLDLEPNPCFSEHENERASMFKISNCKPDIKLIRELKRFRGFKSNEKHFSDSNYLPEHDLTNWLSSLEIFDSYSPQEVRNPPIYNLRQYYEKSIEYDVRKFGALNQQEEITLSDFETKYLQNLSSPSVITEVDTSIELPSVKHNFNLLTNLPSSERAKVLKDNWQLNRLPLQRDSLLKFLNLDLGEFTSSHIDAGMLFSTKSWSMGSLGMPSLHYNHLGSTKIWYSVPPDQWEKFQNLLNACAYERSVKERKDDGDTENGNGMNFKRSDIYKNFVEASRLDEEEGDFHIHSSLINTESISKIEGQYGGEVILTPDFLRENGIKLNRITQECGSYIFKFPKAYTFNVDSGFCLSENANFAPTSWLLDKDWFKIIANDTRFSPLPRIHPFQFLMNVLLNSNDSFVVGECRKLLKGPIKEELLNRVHLRNLFSPNILRIVRNRFNFVSDFSLQPTGASKIVLSSNSDFINLSLREFLDMVVTTENGSKEIFGIMIDDKCSQIQLHLYYDDTFLEGIIDFPSREIDVHKRKIFDINDLDKLVNIRYANNLVDIDCAREISNTCIGGDGLLRLNDALKDAESLRVECATILERVDRELLHPSPIVFKQDKGFKLIDLQDQINEFCDFRILQKLELQIRQCSIKFPERTKFLHLCEEANRIQSEAQDAIQIGDLETLKRCFALNSSIGIKNDSVALSVGKLLWLRVYHDVFDNPSHNKYEENPDEYSLESMSSFLIFGIKYCGPGELDKLTRVKTAIGKAQEINFKLNELFKGKKSKSKILIEDIDSLAGAISQENLPLDPELLKLLRTVVKSIEKCRQTMAPIWNLLSLNDRLVEDLKILIKNDSIRSLDFFPKFNGGPQDERLQLGDVVEQKMFSRYRKECKHWLADVAQISLKVGTDRAKLKDRLTNCLDLTADLIESPQSSLSGFYCFCREGDNGATMIECEICKEWYHIKCINKGSNWTLSDNTVFLCSLCSTDSTDQERDSNWIDFSNIRNLVLESLELKLLPDRSTVFDLFLMYDKMLTFKRKLEEQVFKEDGQVNTNLPLNNVKYFLRKAYGARCKFGHVSKILEDYCKSQDAPCVQQIVEDGRFIVGKQTQQIKEERPQLLWPISKKSEQ